MLRRAIDGAFLLLFLTMLVVPVCQMVFHIVPVTAINEKRTPFEIPALTARLVKGDPALATDVNRWFDDRYGFRDLLIRTKNQIDFSVFGTAQKVALGKDDWLFLREHSLALVNAERTGNVWHSGIAAKLLTVGRYLQARGITFIVLAVPEKGDMYPMERAQDLPFRPAVTEFDKLKVDLTGSPELVYMDARDTLGPGDPKHPLFWKTDIHHGFDAADLIVNAVVYKIAQLEGTPHRPPRHKWTKEEYVISGDIANFVVKFAPTTEVTTSFKDQWVPDRDTDEGNWSKDPRRVDVPGVGPMPYFDFIYKTNQEHVAGKLPTTVWFGNSFSDMYFAVGVQTYFCEFYRARNVATRFDKSLSNLPPGTKYVVYQYFAPFLESDAAGWKLDGLAHPPQSATRGH